MCSFLNSHGWDSKLVGREIQTRNVSRGERNASISLKPETGEWLDRADSSYKGDWFALCGLVVGIDPKTRFPELLDALAPGSGRVSGESYARPPKANVSRHIGGSRALQNIIPIPAGLQPEKMRNETGRWAYKDKDSLMIMLVIRSDSNGKKRFTPWHYDGKKLVPKMLPGPRPLYNADLIAQNPQATIVVVEGEKSAEALAGIQGVIATTWHGGCSAVAKVDWSALTGRRIVLWPDCDACGVKAMDDASRSLAGVASSVARVPVECLEMPQGWDAADALVEGQDLQKILSMAQPVSVPASAPSSSVPQLFDRAAFPDFVETTRGGIKILDTIANFSYAIDKLGFVVRYNEMLRRVEIEGEESLDVAETRIKSELRRHELPAATTHEFLLAAAMQRSYHPARVWIESAPWDGIPRISALAETIHVEAEYESQRNAYIYRWLISAVAALYAKSFFSKGILTFQGRSHIGKTTWFARLAEYPLFCEGFVLDPDNKDSVIGATSHWLNELGEVESTMRRDIEKLKAFVSSRTDEFRRPYGKHTEVYKRQTVFCASVNSERFLKDLTGNVRWWCIPVLELDFQHSIDVQQIWAEAKVHYDRGEQWWLTRDELEQQDGINENMTEVDPIQEIIASLIERSSKSTTTTWYSATDVLLAGGIRRPTRAESTRCGIVLMQYGFEKRRTSMTRQFRLPTLVQF